MSKSSIVTYTGKVFDYDNIQPSMICIEDIAHSLALTNRYNGMTRFPYSVAEHCVRMATCDELPGDPLAKLLHDAAEAYIGDFVKPLKCRIKYCYEGIDEEKFYCDIKTLEHEIQNAILKAFDIREIGPKQKYKADWTWLNTPEVKQSDMMMLAEEVNVLMDIESDSARKEFDAWLQGVTPAATGLTVYRVYPWMKARTLFYNTFKELTK